MIKNITQEWLVRHSACEESRVAWEKETDHETFATLNRLMDKNPKWANWLIVRLMSRKQKVQYAVFAAEQVIGIYEKKYPDDKRPRKAIEAAKTYIQNPTLKNKNAAAADAVVAAAAAYAAVAAAAAAAYAAAAAAAAAADAAAYAVAAAAAAADAVAAAADAYAAKKEMQIRILKYGIKLLESK